MADRYWVGGTGTWNTSSTTNWSASSGGASGASVPTTVDSVFFDQAGTYTVTLTGTPLSCLDWTVSAGTVTFAPTAGSSSMSIIGSINWIAGTNTSGSFSGQFNCSGGGTKTVNLNGATILGNATVFGAATYNFASSATFGNVSLGSAAVLNTNGYAISTSGFFSFGTLNLSNSIITYTGTGGFINGNLLTLNAGTSQINCIGTGAAICNLAATSVTAKTFYNVSFLQTSTTGATTININSGHTFNNLLITAASAAFTKTVTFAANTTINGTLSTTGTAGNQRVFFASATYGIGFTLTVNSAPSLTDADFRDIYVKGTAAPISGTRIGNRGNCSGITFSTAKTVYWATLAGGNISGNNWAATSGGAVSTDNFPLPQDTATFVNTGLNTSATITFDSTVGFIGSVDFSARTNAVFINLNSLVCYGNLTLGSGWIFNSGSGTWTFSGEGTKTITSAGKTSLQGITVDTYGGTVQLADALNIGAGTNLTITNGTFSSQGYSVTIGGFFSNNGNVRTINLGASTLNIQSGTFNFSNVTNLTFNAGTSQVNWTAGSGFMNTGPLTFYNFSFTNNNTTSISINGSYVFNNLTFTAPASAKLSLFPIAANQTINGTLTCAGASAIRRIFLQSNTIGTQRTLTAAAISADDCDFRDIVIAGAAAGASPTRAGDCGGNSGITFPASKTVYWNLAGSQNWSATAWCTASGGTPDINQFPLPQDTAVFDNAGAAGTVSIDLAWNVGTFDASLRTSAMTFSSSTNAPFVYGDWKFGTGITSSSTTGAITFAKNGTQTITSNGVQFGCPITINNLLATVQLADALSLISARTISLTAGTFDAVTYNVTTGLVNNTGVTTIKMGSGTWTLSGVGTVWGMGGAATLIVGTSTIVLSDTSTTARTFFSSTNFYYNKVTIGGSTGTSTTSFVNNSAYGELASTKTVAHTILLGSSQVFTIGKWSVTGTAGNVVTVGPTTAASAYTLSISGPANTGIDYLSVSYCTVTTTSPGEFYVGVNSTNTAGNTRVIFTATPTPRNLYWVGGTGNWSSTTKWATSSGGVSGAAIPTSLDTVTFDSASNATAYTATIDGALSIARCAAFTMAGPASGNVTFAGGVQIAFHGNVSFAATGITRTYVGSMDCVGNGSYTFTTNGLTLGSNITITGIDSTWTLGSALNIGSLSLTVTYGIFNTSASNYAITCLALSSSSSNIRSILLNSSLISASGNALFGTITNLTFSVGTSQINFSGTNTTFAGGSLTFNNVSFTSAAATIIGFTGANTFNNLTFTGRTTVGINAVTITANQTINGTLTLGAGTAAAYRTFLASDTIGTPRTLTVNALAAGAADIDFRDIVVTGAAAPLTGTRFGDAKGNSGITFPVAKTVYYRQTGSANWATSGTGSWSLTSGGAFDATAFPLAQDTAVFPAATYPASGSTTSINASYNIGTIDMSLRTSNLMTLETGTTSPTIYGDWTNGTGITLSGSNQSVFAGRGNTQTITSAAKVFTFPIATSNIGGTVILSDAFSVSASGAAIVLNNGTFNANNNNVSLTNAAASFSSSNSNIRTLAIGSGTWTIAGTIPWIAASTNLTVTGTGTISLTSASGKTFIGAGVSYSGITLNQGGLGTLTISGNNTFANITKTAVGATTINLAATTQTVGAFTAAGTAGNLLTITGTSAASPATLIYTGVGVISTVDYVVPTFVRAYPTTSTWFAGANSTNGGSLGWIFTASGGVVYAVFITESATALDSISAAFGSTTYLSNIAESNTASNTIAAAALFRSAVSDTANASDAAAAAMRFASFVSDTANATDSISSKATFGSSVSDTVNATDSIAAQEVFGSSISESVTAVDSISAQEILYPAISETVSASETNSASATFLSTVSDTSTATDSVLSNTAFSSAISDTVNVSDSPSAKAVFGSSVNNTITVTDTPSAAQGFGTSVSEQANASQTTAAAQGFRTTIAEQANASETNSATQGFVSNISEQVNANDSISTMAMFAGYLNESATASESNSAKAVFGSNVSDSVTVSDSASSKATFKSNVADTAQALDSISSAATFKPIISESARGQDTDSVAASTFNAAAADNMQASNTFSSRALFGAAVSNTVNAADADVGFIRFPGNITESAAALDSASAAQSFATAVLESNTISDIAASSAVFNAQVSAGSGSGIVQLTSTLPTGTSFAGAIIFDATSAGGGLTVAANGTGTGSSGGFNAGGNYILFSGANTRSVKTISLNLTNTLAVSFYMIKGNNSNGGEQPDGGENIIFRYSTNGGGAYTLISTVIAGGSTPVVNPFTLFTVVLPPAAKTASTILMWQQIASSTGLSDTYGLKDITLFSASSVSASDSVASSPRFVSNVSEATIVSDAIASKATFGSAVNDATQISDSAVGFISFPGSILESAQTTEQNSAKAVFTPAVSDGAAASEFVATNFQVNSALLETAQASETSASNQGFGSSVSESATANGTVLARAIFQGIISEAAQGSDQFSTAAVFLAAFSEFAQAYAEDVGYLTNPASISESSTASDSVSAAGALRGYISESVTGADSIAAKFFHATFINESAQGLDSVDAPGSIYNVITSEQAAVNALPSTNAIFYAAVIAYAGITDVAYARYLWELIDNDQTSDWSNINDTQSAGWVEINDIQASNWQNVGNTQSSGWTEINDTQNPGWERITP